MTNRNCSLILSIALLGCMLVLSPLYGQSESTLKQFFEGKTVVVRIDMPGSHEGVDVYPKGAESIDLKKYYRELSEHGTALPRGQEVAITMIKTKSKHIEFQLNGGGWGAFGSSAYPPRVEKSRRERYLERVIDNEDYSDESASRRVELAKLKRERSKRDEEKKIAWEKSSRLAGGSRFNIRYDSKLTDDDKTPESVIAALSGYLNFPQETFGGPDAITNDDIVKMARVQLSTSIIVTTIKSADSVKFDVSPEGLIALKDAGVDDRVIEAMVARTRGGLDLLATLREPEYILRNFKTMVVDASRAKFFGHDELTGALGDNKDFQPLNITIVDNPAVADVVLKVSYTFPWDYPFSLKHQNTDMVLLSGKGSGPFSGPRGAKSVAKELVKLLRAYRVELPQ